MQEDVRSNQPSWLWVVAGVISILFGLAALFWPGITLVVLVWLFGFYVLVYGIVELIAMFRAISAGTTWWTHLLIGLVSIGVGLYVLFFPGVSAVVLLFTIAFWAIAIGVVEIVVGISRGNFLTVVIGVISILFGLLLLSNPLAGALAYIWVVGALAIVRGILLIVQAFRPTAGRPAAS